VAFVSRRLAAVFKDSESRRCWERAAFIAGHALARHTVLPRREQLPEDTAETLGNALRPCAVDAYLTIDSEIPTLSIDVVSFPYYVEARYARDLSQIRSIRERLDVLFSLADAEAINAVKTTVERLIVKRGKGGAGLRAALHALGLAALAARAEVDEETADLLLYAASFGAQKVARRAAVLPVLAALRLLGEKAPHRYVEVLANASEFTTLKQETARYIYDELQQLKNRLLKAEHRLPLLEAVRAYSNLLIKHLIHIRYRWEETVADMCQLYGEVKKRRAATALNGNPSARRLFDAVAKTHVLAVALYSDVLAPHVQKLCGLGDPVKEAEAVRKTLDEAAARPEELRKIMESDVDFAEWVTARSPTGNAWRVVEDLRGWFTYWVAFYKLHHATNERGELDKKRLEEAAGEFEKAAEMRRKLKRWRNYLVDRSLALKAHVRVANSREELLGKAEGFRELWEEAEEHLEPTARYLATAAGTLGRCLVYLAASGDGKRAEDLLKERRWLLDYSPRASVTARLMLRLFGVGEGAKLEEVEKAFGSWLSPMSRPALLMLTGRLQKDEALKKCVELSKTKDHTGVSSKAEVCVNAVKAAVGDQEAAEILRSKIKKILKLKTESETQVAHPLLDKVDGKTLVEVLAPGYSSARLAFMLLAAVEGRADAVRLHGLWGSARFKEPLLRRLFRAVYENCNNLNSVKCKMALLKLYYYHY